MSLRQQTARGAFWTLLQTGGQRLIGLVVFLVLARLLTPEEFGLMALATVAVALVELFINIGFGEAIVQRKDLEDLHVDSAFWLIMAVGACAALLMAVSSPFIAGLFDQPQLDSMLDWLSLAIVLTALSRVQTALLRRDMKFQSLAMRTLFGATVGGIVGVTAAFMGYGVWALVVQQLSGAVVGVVVLWLAAEWRPRMRFSLPHVRSLFRFGTSILGANVMHYVNQQADRALVGYFLGATAVGLYTVAQRLIHILTEVLARTLANVLYSAFARLQDDDAALNRTYLASAQLAGLITLPVFFGIAAGGEEIVAVVFGEQWLAAAPLMRIIAIAGAIQSLMAFNDPVFKAKGKPDRVFKVGMVRAGLGLTLFTAAVHWGIEAVAYAWLLRTLLVAPISLYWIKNLTGVRGMQFLAQLRVPFFGAVAVVIVIVCIASLSSGRLGPLQLVLTELVVAIPVYIVMIRLLDRELVSKALDLGRLALPRARATRRGRT